jgi:F-box domain
MPSIPIDVLREILEHVRKADLATLCRVSKIFCSCSQDVLYRKIEYRDARTITIQTLAQSTDLARRVRSFRTHYKYPELATALRNMSSLRRLNLKRIGDESILDGCTFKLDSFETTLPYSESLQQFINSQPSLTDITFFGDCDPLTPFDERCLPNLTRVSARPSWLRMLIPGRPVREVTMRSSSSTDSIDFFTLSTTPIQKLKINFDILYSKPVTLLVSILPSLVHLELYSYDVVFLFAYLMGKY